MSQKSISVDGLDMLRSLYDFKATYTKTLNFKENDYFILHQAITKHKHWWEVVNENGEIGYVPSNYVESVSVSPAFYLTFLDHSIDCIRKNNLTVETPTRENEELLEKLKEKKTNIKEICEIQQALKPSLPLGNFDGKAANNCSVWPTQKVQNISETVQKCDKQEKQTVVVNSPVVQNVSSGITHQSVYDLIEGVRINTHLSHDLSRIALVTVVQGLHELLPASVFPYLSTIVSYSSQESLKIGDAQIEQTHDASRLKIIFDELTSCKEDSQQRSWMLYEDESTIKEYLKELLQILKNADVSISKHVLSAQHYHVITTLIQYYQMETRWSLRQLLLQVFGIMCSFDQTIITVMLNSVLPGELARDMMSSPNNIDKLSYSALLLTMIMSMGESMPITNYEFLGVSFVTFVLDNIECPPETDVEDKIAEIFTNLMIAYNLQFAKENKSDNIVLKTLAEKTVIKAFIERLLLLFNREEDPVRIFEHEPKPPHSLLKLFLDIFNDNITANLFYTNDILVLIDIIVRFITDLSTGDERRSQYLELCRRVVRNTCYEEHLHRRDEILKCFTRILCEETNQSKNDQRLVKEIMNEFSQYFQ